jgi:two-component system response regulator PhoP
MISEGKRILLVEDERSVRELLVALLSMDGHAVVEANNGVEALVIFRNQPFDLALIDLGLPFLPGNELAIRLKQAAPRLPILMVTGQPASRGADNPVDAILPKPFEIPELRHLISQLLEKARAAA